MKYFLQLSCFAFMFGIYIAVDDLYMFLPQQPIPPPPECPPNEAFKIYLNNCSNCEQRGFCILKEWKRNGCDCIPHFVRLTPDGPCVPESMCPQPECKENEVFRECGPMCERCGTFNCKMVHCEHRCYCKEGYKRNISGTCIPEDECPPKERCPREEEMRDSGYEDEYCLHENNVTASNATINVTQCYCKEGLRRNGLGHCMPEKYCAIVRCLGVETYQNCPRKCNATCRTYGDPDCVEDGQCYPGCFCPEGYLMNDFRNCVPLEHCPPGSNPYVPTLPPPEETTIPASVDEDSQQDEATTPTTDTDENEKEEKSSDTESIAESSSDSQTQEAIAAAESEGDELPENLPDEDIDTDDEADETTSSASTSLEKKQKEQASSSASASASASADAESASEVEE